jgi:late competence protein required for DNA uptake (superfamily II DNA/RNA helicase)
MIIPRPKYEIIKARYHVEQTNLLSFNVVKCFKCGEKINKAIDLYKIKGGYYCRDCVKNGITTI